VLDTATTIAERVGADGLTMSLVAEELGVSPTALYYYVRNKQVLVDLVIDRALDRVEAPPVDAGPWDVRLRMFEQAVRNELRRLKRARPELISDGDLSPAVRRLFTIGVEILSETGADEREVRLAFTTVYAYMLGQLWLDQATSDVPDKELQRIQAVRRQDTFDTDDLFDYGIEVVIAGLRPRLEPTAPKTQRRKR
jgi:AcrR family transcriptional regulator